MCLLLQGEFKYSFSKNHFLISLLWVSFFPLCTILRWLILNRQLLISNKRLSFLLQEYSYLTISATSNKMYCYVPQTVIEDSVYITSFPEDEW